MLLEKEMEKYTFSPDNSDSDTNVSESINNYVIDIDCVYSKQVNKKNIVSLNLVI